ncbi:hypothetical protein A2422_03700 [Candidatus Woesebacteria bacterium RIFOXYC1_FULL_31_51]|nr:MAG: Transposase [Candidatus Woesebacteria bacterium GW2011_GWF1_31_35]OGM73240.1 MAG: hypothetical protein A2185_01470 [Candidatus Woesebacteria bacterium RIFOXYA1_FULL_31_71]OGM78192.1 MAG: hypothetical protein A2375_04075 [Candidatus Woesebacteria bacterium RIFOXYB1_FULL_31_120]OGM83173.1 MAG: hypothetical protein A2422_03700 [Candidatus Woesebacteria bacterium RIFOXYC1_FULL_31_51]OGM86091.1 MAG: hypothetical protein A2595_00010 [Candidatus Woesebacteria bacterium RIFOXYD1_FULL_31_53]HLD
MNTDLNIRLSISEASKLLKISKDTLRRWERNGYIKPLRTPTNRRYYNKLQLISIYNTHHKVKHIKIKSKIVINRWLIGLFIFFVIIDLTLLTIYLINK